ncbi:aromatase/cyclase [Streptomyces sp. NPDC014894]|uniref:aromatase/cyclase n=1 Tax=Streptomyces sp. NPDC014894 TaxID=3364931 RepID=UPI003700BAC2
MPEQALREVEHEITVAAPPERVYDLIADVRNWPSVFPPTVHVDHVSRGESQERIQIWATVNGTPRQWTSRRTLDRDALRVEFRQEVPSAPIAAMGGAWIVEPAAHGGCRVRLLHDYRAAGDDPETLRWIDRAVDANSGSELAALKHHAELTASAADLFLDFEDTVRIRGSAKDAYAFVAEAQHWADRLPHVASVSLAEDSPGLQILGMETRTPDGSTHTTESVRVCFPHHTIVYKQTTLPPLMSLHTGRWRFEEDGSGTTAVTSRHIAVIDPGNIARALGADAGIPEARRFLRDALGANSRATLSHAGAHAEARAAAARTQ